MTPNALFRGRITTPLLILFAALCCVGICVRPHHDCLFDEAIQLVDKSIKQTDCALRKYDSVKRLLDSCNGNVSDSIQRIRNNYYQHLGDSMRYRAERKFHKQFKDLEGE